MLILTLLLTACEPDGGTGDDTSTTCNEANEACDPGSCGGEGANMLPGSDCLTCHTPGGAEEAPTWTAGGTAFADIDGTAALAGAIIRIFDADGNTVELTSNSVGNFYSSQALTPPLTAELELDGVISSMSREIDEANCNSCHSCAGEAGGKLTSL